MVCRITDLRDRLITSVMLLIRAAIRAGIVRRENAWWIGWGSLLSRNAVSRLR
jgi:hypothetical protein